MLHRTSRSHWLRVGLIVGVFVLCAPMAWGEAESHGEELQEPGLDTFTWKALPYVEGEALVCWLEPSGEPGIEEVVCFDACPSRGICAEFSNRHGVVDLVCCIDPETEGTGDVGDCLLEATLVRGGAGPPEVWDIPWI